MRSGILRIHIKTLRLRIDAPWPSQIKNRARKWLRPPSLLPDCAHALCMSLSNNGKTAKTRQT